MAPAANLVAPLAPHAWRWPVAIVGLLCVHAVAMVTVVFMATRDPSFSVEPNSYRKAVDWDISQARRRASEQLGWSAQIQVSPTADTIGRRQLSCRLTDKQGVAVVAATVQVEWFHHARAADRRRVTLEPEPDGSYSALLPMKRNGTWEFRITARRGSSLFNVAVTEQVRSAT